MLKVLSVIAGILSSGYSLFSFFVKIFKKDPVDKFKEIIAESDKSIEKAKKSGDTSDIENLINK